MLATNKERARRLRETIKRLGYKTIRGAARDHGIGETTLVNHTNGTRAFDLETGYLYATKFGVDPAWLLGLSNERREQPEIPTEVIRHLMEETIQELPIGATISDFLRIVPQGLSERLKLYLIDAGFQGTVLPLPSSDTNAQFPPAKSSSATG